MFLTYLSVGNMAPDPSSNTSQFCELDHLISFEIYYVWYLVYVPRSCFTDYILCGWMSTNGGIDFTFTDRVNSRLNKNVDAVNCFLLQEILFVTNDS
jgi:hypothetical protein